MGLHTTTSKLAELINYQQHVLCYLLSLQINYILLDNISTGKAMDTSNGWWWLCQPLATLKSTISCFTGITLVLTALNW